MTQGWQRVAYYFALTHFLWLVVDAGIRVYFDRIVRDPDGYRQLSKHAPLFELFLLSVLNWIVAFFLVAVSILESRRITRYGVATVLMLSVAGVPVAIGTIWIWWDFLSSL